MFIYKNGVYYMDSLQDAVDAPGGDDNGRGIQMKYISAFRRIQWDDFANDFSVQVYNNKADYRKKTVLIISALTGASWRGCYIFYQWACTQTAQ